jgi:hypothetical protein
MLGLGELVGGGMPGSYPRYPPPPLDVAYLQGFGS